MDRPFKADTISENPFSRRHVNSKLTKYREKVPCSKCGKFVRENALILHILAQHGGPRLPCPTTGCLTTFSYQHTLNQHLKKNSNRFYRDSQMVKEENERRRLRKAKKRRMIQEEKAREDRKKRIADRTRMREREQSRLNPAERKKVAAAEKEKRRVEKSEQKIKEKLAEAEAKKAEKAALAEKQHQEYKNRWKADRASMRERELEKLAAAERKKGGAKKAKQRAKLQGEQARRRSIEFTT